VAKEGKKGKKEKNRERKKGKEAPVTPLLFPFLSVGHRGKRREEGVQKREKKGGPDARDTRIRLLL